MKVYFMFFVPCNVIQLCNVNQQKVCLVWHARTHTHTHTHTHLIHIFFHTCFEYHPQNMRTVTDSMSFKLKLFIQNFTLIILYFMYVIHKACSDAWKFPYLFPLKRPSVPPASHQLFSNIKLPAIVRQWIKDK